MGGGRRLAPVGFCDSEIYSDSEEESGQCRKLHRSQGWCNTVHRPLWAFSLYTHVSMNDFSSIFVACFPRMPCRFEIDTICVIDHLRQFMTTTWKEENWSLIVLKPFAIVSLVLAFWRMEGWKGEEQGNLQLPILLAKNLVSRIVFARPELLEKQ